mmetsp:Transcript_17302/g.35858  ORF Transcript_17302/g.35858 Transcript_17302/m.35858 type:complete len:304 (+) Transcript_17302:396-1307(+)
MEPSRFSIESICTSGVFAIPINRIKTFACIVLPLRMTSNGTPSPMTDSNRSCRNETAFFRCCAVLFAFATDGGTMRLAYSSGDWAAGQPLAVMKRDTVPNNRAVDLKSIGASRRVASSSSPLELIKRILMSRSELFNSSLKKVSRDSDDASLSNFRESIVNRVLLPSSSISIRSRHSSASSSSEMLWSAFTMRPVYSTRSANRVSSSGTTPRAAGSQKTSSNSNDADRICTYRQTAAARELLPMPRIPPIRIMFSTRRASRILHMSTSRPVKNLGSFGRNLRASSSRRLSASRSGVLAGTGCV